jgi:hypothetical protein
MSDAREVEVVVSADVKNMDNRVVITGLGRAEAVGFAEEVLASLPDSQWGKYAEAVRAELTP